MYPNFLSYIEWRREEDLLRNMGIGAKGKIDEWMEEMAISRYIINDDATIDVWSDVNLKNKGIKGSLPPFIKFRTIYGSFYISGNHIRSLRGFPYTVHGDLSIHTNGGFIWGEDQVRKYIKIEGKVWN